MKYKFSCILLLTICQATLGQKPDTKNYLFSYFISNGQDGLHLAHSTDGYTWTALKEGKSFLTPTAGKDKLMRDPSVQKGPDGIFHMVWTVSWGEKGIGHATSSDLITWSEQQYIPVMEHEPGTQNCWAPELFFDKASNRFIIVWATSIPGRFNEGEGQKSNHRLYYVTTKDFKKYSPAQLLYDHGFSVIDAILVKEGKQYVMFLKDETDKPFEPQKNLRIAYSKKLTGPYSKPGKPITGKYWAEGPTAIKINGKWFVYFDKYTEHKYGLITSTDLNTWTDESDKLTVPAGIRHGTTFEVSADVVEKLKAIK